MGNKLATAYYDRMAANIKSPLATRNKSADTAEYDSNFVLTYSVAGVDSLLDLGSGTGLLINKIQPHFKKIVAVEKYAEFSKFIDRHKHIRIVNEDILLYSPDMSFDLVTIFGVMNFFSTEEAVAVYGKARGALQEDGRLIVKHQMGVDGDVLVDYSAELNQNYFSEYRHVDKEVSLLRRAGFTIEDICEIYPDSFNRWETTRFKAIVARPASR